ncbi:hypothetical protein HPB52_010058 [Rhipicephalus sanguineus]|uniref:CCHC-type domain-containing protein n=1 Tax=Rhipicephalus sanguineus TaxID=34632 RepID=A0A9D4PGI5_RHISA|nr:hypothetical protein HPB52_010058 [Rhipicephalus sanguineus]
MASSYRNNNIENLVGAPSSALGCIPDLLESGGTIRGIAPHGSCASKPPATSSDGPREIGLFHMTPRIFVARWRNGGRVCAMRILKTRWANAFSPSYGPFSVHATRDAARSSRAGRVPQGADGVNPMESAASAGDAQDTDADVRTMDVQQECDESPATTDNEEGWHTVHHGRRRKPGHGSVGDADGGHGADNKGEPSMGKTQANTQERRINRIEKASRMPKLPAGDYKIVIRPRGGLCVAALGPMDITRGIHEAAATPLEVRQFDVICPNKTQNIMVVSTPDPDRADQYRKIKKILIRGKEHEVAAYETAPEDTAKGIIRGIPLEETPDSIRAALVTERNHSVITAKRLGSTTTVIVLFSGNKVPSSVCYDGVIIPCALYRNHIDYCKQCNRLGHRGDVCPNPEDKLCPGCGIHNPKDDHRCDPKCQICGKDHATADKSCTAKDNGPEYKNITRKAHLNQEDVHASARHLDLEDADKQDPGPVQGTPALKAPGPAPGRHRRLRDQLTG